VVRIRDSADHSAPVGYSAPADSSPAGCSEQAGSAEAAPADHSLASLPADFRTDSQRVAASQAVKAPRHSLAVQRSQRLAESSSLAAAVLQAVRDAAPAPAVSPQTTAAVAVALF